VTSLMPGITGHIEEAISGHGKVQALSNAVSRTGSPKMIDIVEEITDSTFINVTCNCWSSDFSAVKCVLSIGLEKLKQCQTALKHDLMTDADMQFLAKVMKLVVLAMNLLQGKTTIYIGNVTPTITGVKSKLDQTTDRAVESLVSALFAGINSRFQAVLSDKEHLVASILHPQFKLNF